MKTLSILILCSLFTFSSFSLETIEIASEDYLPYTSKNISHKGFVSKIVKKSFEAVKIEANFRFFSGARSFKLAKDGVYVATVPWAHRVEREEFFYYSDPVSVADVEMFFVLKNSDFDWDASLQKISDLRGISIGAVRSYNYGEEFQEAERNGVINVRRVNDVRQNFRKLFNKKIDVVISHKQVALHHLNNSFSKSHKYRIKSFPVKVTPEKFYYILFSKVNPRGEEMRDKFNEGLSIIKRNGELDQILKELKDGRFIETNQ